MPKSVRSLCHSLLCVCVGGGGRLCDICFFLFEDPPVPPLSKLDLSLPIVCTNVCVLCSNLAQFTRLVLCNQEPLMIQLQLQRVN